MTKHKTENEERLTSFERILNQGAIANAKN